MRDSIDRQAAIDVLNNAFDRETLLYGFVRSIAVRAIRNMPSAEPKWIPVTERLPNDEDYHNFAQFPDGAVLWCTDKGVVGAGWYYESTKSWSCLDDTFPERYGNVIAWMQLPKPYQEEEHEQH